MTADVATMESLRLVFSIYWEEIIINLEFCTHQTVKSKKTRNGGTNWKYKMVDVCASTY